MLNRLVSNFVLGFFVVVLVVVYSVAKQVPGYQNASVLGTSVSANTDSQDVSANNVKVAADSAGMVQIFSPNGKIINAKVADTEAERTQGLSGTDTLAEGAGMLFVFDSADLYGIWMKEMKYDIDIVWLDKDGNVVNVVADAKMPVAGTVDSNLTVYKNSAPALYVLELPSGAAVKEGFAVGSKAKVY